MKLMKCIKDYIRNPKKKVAELMPELLALRVKLYTSTDCQPLFGIVQFFNVVSAWQDRSDELGQTILALQEVNHGQHSELIQKLEVLRKHFQNAGRDRYGWNRTEKGETVTDDKVFLGNIFGLWTFPVSKWKQGKDKKKGGWGYGGMEHLSPYDVVSNQAQQFMASHVNPMCEIINWLENQEGLRKVA